MAFLKFAGKLNLVVALPCEAKPLVKHFNLKKLLDVKSFDLYANVEKNIHLIISGIGKTKSAAATTLIHQLSGNFNYSCFCNIGIAGSGNYQLGEMVVVNKIIEKTTKKTWYPKILSLPKVTSDILLTCDIPEINYPEKGLVDMEAVGFYSTAALFVTQEHLQVIKIVSDNCQSSLKNINSVTVNKLIEQNLNQIELLLNRLLILSQSEQEIQSQPNHYSEFKTRWHFTDYQQHQLRESLRRWQALNANQDPIEVCHNAAKAKDVLHNLMDCLETSTIRRPQER